MAQDHGSLRSVAPVELLLVLLVLSKVISEVIASLPLAKLDELCYRMIDFRE